MTDSLRHKLCPVKALTDLEAEAVALTTVP